MLLSWLRSRRRRAIAERPFPAAWTETLRRSVRQVSWLSDDDRGRLQAWVAVFLAEKRFEGCGGMEVTDDVRLAVAGQVGLTALGFAEAFYPTLHSILVYPGDYVVPKSVPIGGGAELQWHEPRLGETWSGGSMVLSWPRVVEGGRMRDGPRSVVIHECAHLFDMVDGEVDGVPPVPGPRGEWADDVRRCRERFEAALDDGRATAFDDYAAESDGEFFAVASECFFQDPHRLVRHDELLYRRLSEAWRQDPRQRVPPRDPRDR
jgi:Mlc titration factor MtfA (ptsG expression regulator)